MSSYSRFLDAVRNGRLNECQQLFVDIEDINIFMAEEIPTPIYWAVLNGDLTMCQWMHNVGAVLSWGCKYNDEETLMIAASRKGHLKVCQWLLQNDSPEILSELDYDENTPMLHACQNGHLTIASWLFEKGASSDIDTENRFGDTPMSVACRDGHQPVCQWLIEVGVTLDSCIESLVNPFTPIPSESYELVNSWLLQVINDHLNFQYCFLLGTFSKRNCSKNLEKLNVQEEFKGLILDYLVGTQKNRQNILTFGYEITPHLSKILNEPELERVIPKDVPTFGEFLNL